MQLYPGTPPVEVGSERKVRGWDGSVGWECGMGVLAGSGEWEWGVGVWCGIGVWDRSVGCGVWVVVCGIGV